MPTRVHPSSIVVFARTSVVGSFSGTSIHFVCGERGGAEVVVGWKSGDTERAEG